MNRHARLAKLGLDTDPVHASRLITCYAASRTPTSLSYACKLFHRVPCKDTVLWSSIISAYTRHAQFHTALHLFSSMLHQSTHLPNHFVYATIATACGGSSTETHLQLGRTVHSRVLKSGFVPNYVVVETALLDMYSKCGSIECAWRVFDEMPRRSLVTWNAMIAGCVYNGKDGDGLELFYVMKCEECFVPDEFTVATVLRGCAKAGDVKLGFQVHGYLIVKGYELDCMNAVCNMYFHFGEVSCAEKISNGIEESVVLKLIKIRGYVSNQMYHKALRCVVAGENAASLFLVDCTALVPVLTASAKLSLLRVGRQLHGLLITSFSSLGNSCLIVEDAAFIGSALIDMYCKCNNLGEAEKVFRNWAPTARIHFWNSMISGYMYNGLVEEARVLWEEMPEKNVVSWTSMISGYVQHNMPEEGLSILSKMYAHDEGVRVRVDGNCLTFVSGLEACTLLTDLERGREIHGKIIRLLMNIDTSNVIVGTALVDMYSKSGRLNYAQTVFSRMSEKNVPAWTSLIMGYAVHGFGSFAVAIFQQMLRSGIEPNEVTFVAVLTACSHSGLVEEGLCCFKLMKGRYREILHEDHLTCLIDMLGRAGRLDEAWSLVEELEDTKFNDENCKSKIFGAMIGACHMHGNVELGKKMALKMLETKKEFPTSYATLSNVYAAAGLWDEVYTVRENWRATDVNGQPGSSHIRTK